MPGAPTPHTLPSKGGRMWLQGRGCKNAAFTKSLDSKRSSRRVVSVARCVSAEKAPSKVVASPEVVVKPSSTNGTGSHSQPEEVDCSSIVRFLEGRKVLITGATGFLAKVLVEKILREQPDVGQLYLLVRTGKQTAEQRLQEVMSTPVFDALRQRYGEGAEAYISDKVSVVEGNLAEKALGMDSRTVARLQREVDVVINSAATTTFDEEYDIAVRVNTLGAVEAARFAAGCRNLKVLVHVSTAFVNGKRRGAVAEKPFRMGDSIAAELEAGSKPTLRLDVDAEVAMAEASRARIEEEVRAAMPAGTSGEVLEQVSSRLKKMGMDRAERFGWQDTYVFTKSLGEQLLGREAHRSRLPVAIVRPSIVESAWQEPMRGWMEGIRMCDPIILAYGKGQMSGFAGDHRGVLDVIPVDHVINAMLASMPRHCLKPGITVYHVATSCANPLIIQSFVDLVSAHFQESPMLKNGEPISIAPMRIFRSPDAFIFDSWQRYELPLELADAASTLRRTLMPWAPESKSEKLQLRKLRLVAKKTMSQLTYMAQIYSPYTFYKCGFCADNTEELYRQLSPEEQAKFGFDLRALDWAEYIKDVHIPGLRKYVLKGRV